MVQSHEFIHLHYSERLYARRVRTQLHAIRYRFGQNPSLATHCLCSFDIRHQTRMDSWATRSAALVSLMDLIADVATAVLLTKDEQIDGQ